MTKIGLYFYYEFQRIFSFTLVIIVQFLHSEFSFKCIKHKNINIHLFTNKKEIGKEEKVKMMISEAIELDTKTTKNEW